MLFTDYIIILIMIKLHVSIEVGVRVLVAVVVVLIIVSIVWCLGLYWCRCWRKYYFCHCWCVHPWSLDWNWHGCRQGYPKSISYRITRNQAFTVISVSDVGNVTDCYTVLVTDMSFLINVRIIAASLKENSYIFQDWIYMQCNTKPMLRRLPK